MRVKILLFLIIILSGLLRVWKLGTNPPSLYWDEASLGYNAFSIATSLRDEHGEFLPTARFIAFGDYKPPGYIYAVVPFVKALGLSEWSVRLPSALSGILLAFLAYLIASELFNKKRISLTAALLIAISPWSIHLSRGAFEANLAAVFNALTVYLILKSRQKGWYFVLASLSGIAAFYTFNANRISTPLLIVFMSFILYKSLKNKIFWILFSVIICGLSLLPSFGYLKSRESRLRYDEVSIFKNLAPVENSNSRIERENSSILAKLFQNRRIYFARLYLQNYVSNFYPRYLFIKGDVNPRINIPSMGQLYLFELPLILAGGYFLLTRRKKESLILLAWLLIVPIPASVARESPHALRSVSLLPAFQIISGVGFYFVLKKIRIKTALSIFNIACTVLVSGNLFYYLHHYWIHFPRNLAGEWQYGYKQMVEKVTSLSGQFDQIFVTEAVGRPYIYFAFYNQISKNEFAKTRVADRDWYGLWTVHSLGKIHFGFTDLPNVAGKTLVVSTSASVPTGYEVFDAVNNLKGDSVFVLAKKP